MAGTPANRVWSVAGDDDRADVDPNLVQPFLSSTTPEASTFTVQTESIPDRAGGSRAVPANLVATRVVPPGHHPPPAGGGVWTWVERHDNGPGGFGVRSPFTLLFSYCGGGVDRG